MILLYYCQVLVIHNLKTYLCTMSRKELFFLVFLLFSSPLLLFSSHSVIPLLFFFFPSLANHGVTTKDGAPLLHVSIPEERK